MLTIQPNWLSARLDEHSLYNINPQSFEGSKQKTSELFSDICKSSWESEKIPYQWEASNIAPLFKKRIMRQALLAEISNFNTDSVQNLESMVAGGHLEKPASNQ